MAFDAGNVEGRTGLPFSNEIRAPSNPTPQATQATQRRQRILDTLATLAERFPAAFALHRPLKVSIHLDLRERAAAITNAEIAEALKFHCGALAYLLALTEGATRLDLDGSPAGQVTADEAAHAKATIAAIRERAPPKPTARHEPERAIGTVEARRLGLATPAERRDVSRAFGKGVRT